MSLLWTRTMIAATAASWALVVAAKSPAEWQALTAPLQVSMEQAVQAATQLVPGQVLEVELDSGDRGKGVRYEAEVLGADGQRSEVWVDGVSGQALVHKRESYTKAKDVQRAKSAQLDIAAAVQAATAHTAGKAVGVELDSHRDTTIYKVKVLQADHTVMKLKLDAVSGQVLEHKRDD